MNVRATVATILVVLVAGCSGGGGEAAGATPGGPSASLGSFEGDTGSISGYVVSDELQPIPNAMVGIVALNLITTVDSSGAFVFPQVPVGSHALAVQALGFESQAKQVEVVADTNLDLQIVLAPVPVADPYFEIFPHRLFHGVGQTYVSFAVNLTGQSGECESCVWVIETGRSPDNLLVEIDGRHSIQKVGGEPLEYFWMFRNCYDATSQDDACNTIILEGYYDLPSYAKANRTDGDQSPGIEDRTRGIGNDTVRFWNQVTCEFYWICFQEGRDVWITMFHEMEVPANFTAKPDQ